MNGSTTTRVHLPESGRFEQKHFKYKIFKITKKLIVQLFLGLSHEVHIQDMCVLHVYVCRKRGGLHDRQGKGHFWPIPGTCGIL